MRNSYKYFQKGDKIISINGRRRPRIFREPLGSSPTRFMIYTFRGYVPKKGNKPDYQLLFTEETDYIFDGYEFMSMLEYRKLQLKRLKRKMFFNKIFCR
jgi:hypothetical protein